MTTYQPRSGCVLQPNVAAPRGYVGINNGPYLTTAKRLRLHYVRIRAVELLSATKLTQPLRGRGLVALKKPNVAAKRGNVGLKDATASP